MFLLLSFPTEGAVEKTGQGGLRNRQPGVEALPRWAILRLSNIARSVSHVPLPPCLWPCKLRVYSEVSPSEIEVAGRKKTTSPPSPRTDTGAGQGTHNSRQKRTETKFFTQAPACSVLRSVYQYFSHSTNPGWPGRAAVGEHQNQGVWSLEMAQ